jgi:hypothetical protein
MKKQNLQEEINRIKNLMVFEVGYVKDYTSLDNLFEDTTSTTTKCSSKNNTIQDPEVKITAYDPKNQRIRAGMKIFFGATKTKERIKNAFNKLVEGVKNYNSIPSDVKEKLESGELILRIEKILNVIGSASSFRGKAVLPTITNDKANVEVNAINVGSFSANINKNDVKYKGLTSDEKNNGYALGRVNTITDFIRTPGNLEGIQAGMDVPVQRSTAVITDTGPCVDENRPKEKYPNPGQFAFIDLYAQLKPRVKIVENPTKCINKITIKIGFDPKLVTDKKNDHNCDFAIFDLYANDIFIRTINLSNYVFDTGEEKDMNSNGIKITDFTDGRDSDNLTHGKRMYTLVIKQGSSLWNSIMKESPKFGNKIRITYKGKPREWYEKKNIYASGAAVSADSHSSAVYLDITLQRTDKTTDNVKGWTSENKRGTSNVTIAVLTPCLKSKNSRIRIS